MNVHKILQEMTDMYYLNRTACDVLEEMRKLNKNLSMHTIDRHQEVMKYLIEEAQSMYNKMEAGLGDKRDLKSMSEEHAKQRKKYKERQKELLDLKDKIRELEGKDEDGVCGVLDRLGLGLDLDEPLDEGDE